MWTVVWLITVVLNSHDGKEPTDRLIPDTWQGNPWGPEANRARAIGAIPPIAMTPLMSQWDAWGKSVLRDGDILFRRGDAKVLGGRFPFSKFLAAASNSRFSHTAIVSIEEKEPFVYDITKAGVRRQPFHVWILDNAGAFGVKRLRAEDQRYTAKALQTCRDWYARQVPFDYDLDIDDRAYYCIEMTEKAYRASGIALSEPVRLGDMENITRFPICVLLFLKLSNLTLEQPVYFPGNDHHGIWSCPRLVTIYESKPTPEEQRGWLSR